MTALGVLMMTSSLTGFGGNIAPNVASEVIEVKNVPNSQIKKSDIQKTITVEQYVRNYFSDIPIMIEVARCESRFRQHGIDGDVLRGEKNNLDRGVMQINESYHNETSEKLGYDIMTIEGNTAYARHLYEKYGVKPWASSSRCWKRSDAYEEYTSLALK